LGVGVVPSDGERKLYTLKVVTYEPGKYELLNHEDGTRWRGTVDGWRRIPARDDDYTTEAINRTTEQDDGQ
jgi:hypothetical protein